MCVRVRVCVCVCVCVYVCVCECFRVDSGCIDSDFIVASCGFHQYDNKCIVFDLEKSYSNRASSQVCRSAVNRIKTVAYLIPWSTEPPNNDTPSCRIAQLMLLYIYET